jgi:hypothetical protein
LIGSINGHHKGLQLGTMRCLRQPAESMKNPSDTQSLLNRHRVGSARFIKSSSEHGAADGIESYLN